MNRMAGITPKSLAAASLILGLVSIGGRSVANGASIKPIKIDSTRRFTVTAQAFSASDMTMNCTDLTTLPPGPVMIESIDVHAFTLMALYLEVPTRSPNGSESFGVPARIPVVLVNYPGGTDAAGHVSTAVVIRDGGLATALPGEATRDDAHPVRLCVRDSSASSSINSWWTVSGAIGR